MGQRPIQGLHVENTFYRVIYNVNFHKIFINQKQQFNIIGLVIEDYKLYISEYTKEQMEIAQNKDGPKYEYTERKLIREYKRFGHQAIFRQTDI